MIFECRFNFENIWVFAIFLNTLWTVNHVTGKENEGTLHLKRPLKSCKLKFDGSFQVKCPHKAVKGFQGPGPKKPTPIFGFRFSKNCEGGWGVAHSTFIVDLFDVGATFKQEHGKLYVASTGRQG